MLEQYKKTFLSTQLFIAGITAILYFKLGHNALMAVTFLATMELGGFVGAAWASRLKRILGSRRV